MSRMVISCFFTFRYNTEHGIFLDFANFLNDIFCPFAIYSEMYCARRGSFFQHLRVDLVVDVAAVAVVAVGDGAVVVVVVVVGVGVADAIAGAAVKAAVAARISKFDVVAAAAGGDDTVAPDASDISAVADIIDADPDAVDADAVDVVVALDI